ncbi:hypothetical protein CEUSTIGMA_g10466.t1 [Chlamydomonas eustigma]|uniref:Gamma-secretase subunit PEN-2 n=1 Tax=Chlamydomonas eustigma TaxID=1157962 RepID=A0A250XJR0_9CHLO|nr:hypothetical protein CEUSTIGMA_g10466.t1 [Chlamydomonas eustigma]|eukprot:GAX83040.1 hypothetical protein CEUSTIGMA_g10466.t1 [Chlamydomonas eustigma]
MDAPLENPVDPPSIESVDGEIFPTDKARTMAKRMFWGGFAFLPLLWFVNIWLFWHEFRSRPGADPCIKKYTRYSAIAFTIASILFLPWLLLYTIAGSWLLDPRVYRALDVINLNIANLGIPSAVQQTA